MYCLNKKIIAFCLFQKIVSASYGVFASEDPASLTIQFSELQQEVQQLNGKIEELSHQLEQLNKKMETSVADFELRFEDKKPLIASALSTEKELPSGNIQEKYETAIQLLRTGEYAGARQAFLSFIQTYPTEELVIQAHYWYGMTYFLEKDYKKASKIFAENYQKYPKSPKTFDSLLRLAQALGALGRTKDACTTLDELLSSLPDKQKNPLREEAEKEKIFLKCPG